MSVFFADNRIVLLLLVNVVEIAFEFFFISNLFSFLRDAVKIMTLLFSQSVVRYDIPDTGLCAPYQNPLFSFIKCEKSHSFIHLIMCSKVQMGRSYLHFERIVKKSESKRVNVSHTPFSNDPFHLYAWTD